MSKKNFIENIHYYLEDGKVIMTEKYHVERGSCCGSGCRHCAYSPVGQKGNTNLKDSLKNIEKDL